MKQHVPTYMNEQQFEGKTVAMTRTLQRRDVLSWIGMVALNSCVAFAMSRKEPGHPLYVVKKGSAKVFIFGEAAPTTHRWLTPKIDKALRTSRELWRENPTTPDNGDQKLFQQLSRRSEGTLFDDLTSSQAERLLRAARKVNLSRETLDPLLPWAVGSILSLSNFQNPDTARVAYDDVTGTLLNIAKEIGIPVHSEFASWDDFPRFFAAMPRPVQIQYISYTLDNIERPVAEEAKLSERWTQGDVSGFERANNQLRTRYPELYAVIEIGRNKKWAERIGDMLDRGGAYFVDVGVHHTIGPESIQVHCHHLGISIQTL